MPCGTTAWKKLAKINAHRGGPNPYLETAADMQRYGDIQDHCLPGASFWTRIP